MLEVTVKDIALQKAAEQGMDAFLQTFIDAIYQAIGGELTADTMSQLNADQMTLLAYDILHKEVMDGGFIQLIHNGYGAFIFHNPFDKAVRAWGMIDLFRIMKKCHNLYRKYGEEIERDCSEDEFMALFEKYPEFDDYDDTFVENEERWTSEIANYVDQHIDKFAKII